MELMRSLTPSTLFASASRKVPCAFPRRSCSNWAMLRNLAKRQISAQPPGNSCQQHREWHFTLVHFVPAGQAQVIRVARWLRAKGLIPDEEVNDSLALAESALLNCSML